MRLIEQSFLLHRNVLRDRVMGKKILMRPTMILIPADWLHQDQVQPVAFRSSKLVQWSFPFLSYSLETHSLTPATHSLPEKSYHIFTHRSLLPKANSALNYTSFSDCLCLLFIVVDFIMNKASPLLLCSCSFVKSVFLSQRCFQNDSWVYGEKSVFKRKSRVFLSHSTEGKGLLIHSKDFPVSYWDQTPKMILTSDNIDYISYIQNLPSIKIQST